MDMDLSLDYSQDMGMGMKVSPTPDRRQPDSGPVLAGTQQAIKLEAEENPAFEIVEHADLPHLRRDAQGPGLRQLRPRAIPPAPRAAIAFNFDEFIYNQDYAVGGSYNATAGDEEFDPMTLVAAERTLGERLMADLRDHPRCRATSSSPSS